MTAFLDTPFVIAGLSGTICRQSSLTRFRQAVLVTKLVKGLGLDESDFAHARTATQAIEAEDASAQSYISANSAALLVIGDVMLYARLFSRLTTAQADGLHWPTTTTATPAEWVAAFEFAQLHSDWFNTLDEEIKRLDLPNGIEGAAESQLTEAQKQSGE